MYFEGNRCLELLVLFIFPWPAATSTDTNVPTLLPIFDNSHQPSIQNPLWQYQRQMDFTGVGSSSGARAGNIKNGQLTLILGKKTSNKKMEKRWSYGNISLLLQSLINIFQKYYSRYNNNCNDSSFSVP